MLKKKPNKNWLCRLGFHKFREKKERNGYIDIGEYILCHEETWIGCERENCKKAKTQKTGKWIEFKKE